MNILVSVSEEHRQGIGAGHTARSWFDAPCRAGTMMTWRMRASGTSYSRQGDSFRNWLS